jgi:hypothetical protein
MFDLSIYHHIKQNDLIDHILRVGKVFYKNEGQLNNPFHVLFPSLKINSTLRLCVFERSGRETSYGYL